MLKRICRFWGENDKDDEDMDQDERPVGSTSVMNCWVTTTNHAQRMPAEGPPPPAPTSDCIELPALELSAPPGPGMQPTARLHKLGLVLGSGRLGAWDLGRNR